VLGPELPEQRLRRRWRECQHRTFELLAAIGTGMHARGKHILFHQLSRPEPLADIEVSLCPEVADGKPHARPDAANLIQAQVRAEHDAYVLGGAGGNRPGARREEGAGDRATVAGRKPSRRS
jgi:hypothetical protein